MATIRPLERDDVPAVARLIWSHLGWRRDSAALERSLLDHPWTAPEPSTLVALGETGNVIGSIGAQERPVLFAEAKLRGVCVSHLVVEPQHRGGAAGALLVRKLLNGSQDLTFTDSGTEDVVRIWKAFGGDVDHSRTGGWLVIMSPSRWLLRASTSTMRRGADRRRFMPAAALPLHVAGRHILPRAFPEPAPGVVGADATPGEIAEVLATFKDIQVRIDYDEEHLSWLFAHMVLLGCQLSHRTVIRAGRAIGCYVYIQRDTARLIHLAAAPGEAEAVFSDFATHARTHGALALAGRMEPNLDEPLRRRMAAISLAQRPLIHARDPGLRAALGSSRAVLTEMDLIDSEWW